MEAILQLTSFGGIPPQQRTPDTSSLNETSFLDDWTGKSSVGRDVPSTSAHPAALLFGLFEAVLPIPVSEPGLCVPPRVSLPPLPARGFGGLSIEDPESIATLGMAVSSSKSTATLSPAKS